MTAAAFGMAEVLDVVNIVSGILVSVMLLVLNGIRSDLREVKRQTTQTNGRVTTLEAQAGGLARVEGRLDAEIQGVWREIENQRQAQQHTANVAAALYFAAQGKIPE